MDESNYSDAATFGSTSTLQEETASLIDKARFSVLLSDLNHLKKANEDLKVREESLYKKIQSVRIEKNQKRISSSSQSDSLNELLDSVGAIEDVRKFNFADVDPPQVALEPCTSLGFGNSVCTSRLQKNRCKEDGKVRTTRDADPVKSKNVKLDKLEREELLAEIRELTSQLSFQENAIKEDEEIINVLRDTIKIMTEYIAELEKGQGCGGQRGDSFSIFSPSHAAPSGQNRSPSADSVGSSDDLENRFSNVEADILALLRAVQKLRGNHRRIERTPPSPTEPSISNNVSEDAFLCSFVSSYCLQIPHTYRETEFTCRGIDSYSDQVIEHERLTAFSGAKIWQVVESAGKYSLCLQDDNAVVKSFFKFQNFCPMSIGGVVYDINVLFERAYDREWGDVMNLKVCFPGIWDCNVNTPGADIFVDRCLVVLTLLTSNEWVPSLRKYYVLHGIKAHNDPAHGHRSKLECVRGSEEIFDANFCPFHVLEIPKLNKSSCATVQRKFWECLEIEMKVFQLKYRIYDDEFGASKVLTQREKRDWFKAKSHSACSDIVFRIQNEEDPENMSTVVTCDCLMMSYSPLFTEIFQSNNHNIAPCEEIEVRNTTKETLMVILSYLQGMDNGFSWRNNVPVNLEVLGFAYEYFISELAQLSTHNLIATPDCYYTLDLVLKLQAIAKKLRNPDLESRALRWI